ncbi:VPLPA-CTERM sorting domain-containing protein [Aliishimia ponticola]|uniref:VPLPA-CTERM sorting domain-containing protein n=2 Tax=Aliishimia ponticola TaxID=2499833 RepID=A0A4S4NHK7_9RHOB|nr:VPLPA-CTERM sorting domain-containing protein [Aliishimia ponticola]
MTKPTGDLVFAPRIRDTYNIDGGFFAITGMQLTGYGDTSLEVEYRTDGLGDKGPTSASRSADGNTVTLRYGDPLLIGALVGQSQEESLFPSLVTDATDYDLTGTATIFGYLIDDATYLAGGGVVQDGELISVMIDGLAVPISPVPLPASASLLGAGVAGFGLLRRKRRARS